MSEDIFIFDESGIILKKVIDKSIRNVTIPEGVTSIGGGAFYGCSSLTSIKIPNTVTDIGSYAFLNCSSLTSIKIPEQAIEAWKTDYADKRLFFIYGQSLDFDTLIMRIEKLQKKIRALVK